MKWLGYWLVTPLLIALQFLTIIPIRLPKLPTAQQNAASLLFHPLVGLFLGAILWLLAGVISLPVMLTSCLVLVAWVWLTGGLHLDGLADTTDGWVGGYMDQARTLSIMKDSHIGAMGVLSLVVVLMLKWAAIYSLLSSKLPLGFLAVPLLGRLAVLILFLTTPYVSSNGLGTSLQGASAGLSKLVLGLYLLVTLCLLGLQAYPVLLVWGLAIVYLRRIFIKRLDGVTGDTLGASIEIIETTLLITLVYLNYN